MCIHVCVSSTISLIIIIIIIMAVGRLKLNDNLLLTQASVQPCQIIRLPNVVEEGLINAAVLYTELLITHR